VKDHPSGLTKPLLSWYEANARQLPWRGHPDPYAVWVSEVMLQQTRVEAVIPYFLRWMKRFPTIADLAAASQQEVLSAWEGLGYYSRARNLHQATRILTAEHGGQLPGDLQALRRLPGIGRYSAAAIASIAFGQDVPALDGNIRRVLARISNLELPARSPQGERRLLELAARHLPPGRAGDYNQALMELGELVCTPRRPDCARCPLNDQCAAYALGLQELRPVRERKPRQPHHTVVAGVIQRDGQVLIARRKPQGLLGGLWEFPGGKLQPGKDLAGCLRRELKEELGVEVAVHGQIGVYNHAYTHFRVTLHAFRCRLEEGEPRSLEHASLAWVGLQALKDYPMGKIDRAIAIRLAEIGDRPASEG
jgi:A/G-specific adenine glycosylase